jgi:signal transduction histidine kinase
MLERHFAAADHSMYYDDAVFEFPQSGERFVGLENFREWRSSYPASTSVEFREIRGRDDLWIAEISISYDGGPGTSASASSSSEATRSCANRSTSPRAGRRRSGALAGAPEPDAEPGAAEALGLATIRSPMASVEHSVEHLNSLLLDQAALRRVATLVAADPDPRVLFDCVCQELGRVLGVDSTDMVRFDSDDAATVVGTWAASGAPSFPVGSVIPVEGESVTAKIHRSEKPERVDDYTAVDGELAARLREFGIRSAVGAPIRVSGGLWGAVMAVGAEPGAFPAETEQRIAEFAELVTAALANADAREQLAASRARIVEAGYEELRRLERDLHDGAQQEFVGAAISLKLARDKLSQSPDEAIERLDAALERVEAGLRDLRELAAGIHPSVLSDRGLSAALQGLAARSPVPVELAAPPPVRLPASVETTAYFVVAEALTNAAKHARCERVEVAVRLEDGCAVITVSDDGVGGADSGFGSGLRGLADRVSALDGELELDSPHGVGTTLTARIALRGGIAMPGDG